MAMSSELLSSALTLFQTQTANSMKTDAFKELLMKELSINEEDAIQLIDGLQQRNFLTRISLSETSDFVFNPETLFSAMDYILHIHTFNSLDEFSRALFQEKLSELGVHVNIDHLIEVLSYYGILYEKDSTIVIPTQFSFDSINHSDDLKTAPLGLRLIYPGSLPDQLFVHLMAAIDKDPTMILEKRNPYRFLFRIGNIEGIINRGQSSDIYHRDSFPSLTITLGNATMSEAKSIFDRLQTIIREKERLLAVLHTEIQIKPQNTVEFISEKNLDAFISRNYPFMINQSEEIPVAELKNLRSLINSD